MNKLIYSLAILICLLCSSGHAAKTIPLIEKEQFSYYPGDTRVIDAADSILNAAREKMIEILKDSLDYKASIYILDDLKKFNELIRGRIPDWGAAAAFPERKLIAVKSPEHFSINKSLKELLPHEYSHLLLAKRTGFYRPPRWLDEGLAMYISFEWGWPDNLAMSRAGAFGQFLELKEIEELNRFESSKAQIAYAESYLAVEYLIREYGLNTFNRLLDNIASGMSIDDALDNSIGGNYKEFEQEYRKHLAKKYNVASLFMDTLYFWLFLAIVVIVAGFLRFKKRREYYRKWEAEERLQSTDFDYGDPNKPEQIDDEDEPWRN
jgi:hypothetical protein